MTIFATRTAGNPGAFVTVEDVGGEGSIVVYASSGGELWRRPEDPGTEPAEPDTTTTDATTTSSSSTTPNYHDHAADDLPVSFCASCGRMPHVDPVRTLASWPTTRIWPIASGS